MIVALEGMAIDASIAVTAVVEQLQQVFSGLRQVVDVESDVLDKGGGTVAAGAAYSGEYARTQAPPSVGFCRVGGEVSGFEKCELADNGIDSVDVLLQQFGCVGLGVEQHGGEVSSGGVVHGCERLAVEQFARIRR